jgi:hypothetical protein
MKKFLIWLDILGFDEMIEKIARISQRTDSSAIRRDFASIIDERVTIAANKGYIIGKCRQKDSWILVVDSIVQVFSALGCILHHTTSYKNPQKVPLEIAVGVEEYQELTAFNDANLFFLKPTIHFLKTHLTDQYRKLYRQYHTGEPPTETFAVFTEALFQELEPLDREFCTEIKCTVMKSDGKEETVTFFSADIERIKVRSKVYDFLEFIGKPGSKSYDRIDDLYVPPKEYNDIKKLLFEKQIVFITGTAEYGKTYTAVRLLWEYFMKGYEPIWVEGGNERQRQEVGKRLEDIATELRPRCAIYFEDPFGKTTYECRESLEREIGTVIDEIHSINDVHIIITSREEVFKEFEKAKLSIGTIRAFERKLNIRRPSYGYLERSNMLLGWAKSKKCQWLEDSLLKRSILEEIRDEKMLPTPLSIKDFTIATTCLIDEKKLLAKIQEKSMETSKSFAREIMEMSDDKLLLISFPFITRLSIDFVKEEYDALLKGLNLRRPLSFEEVLEWFKDDKIVISSGRIEFSHPSYFEAFEVFFKETLDTNIESSIVSKVLLRLSETDEAAWDVGCIAERYFDKLPDDLRNKLLFRLAKKEKTSKTVAWLLANNFSKIPTDLRTQLLSLLLEKQGTSRAIAWIIRYNFDYFSSGLDNILLKLSETDEASWDVGRIVKVYFNKLPSDLRNELLLKLAKKAKSTKIVTRIIANQYRDLSPEIQNILFELANTEKNARAVSWAISTNFNRLPRGDREKLLLILSGRQEAISNLIRILSDYSQELPKVLVNDILVNCKKIQRNLNLSQWDNLFRRKSELKD